MAIKFSTFQNGKTIAIMDKGDGKFKKTFDSKKEAVDWYNNTFLNGTNRQSGLN